MFRFVKNICLGRKAKGETFEISIFNVGPVMLVNPAGENSSFIFTVCVKSVPLYNFKFAYVVVHMAVNKFFETHF